MKNIIVLIILVFYPSIAFAYIDPGTVGIILQGLIGAIAATIVTLKIYWVRLTKFFGLKKKEEENNRNNIKDQLKKEKKEI